MLTDLARIEAKLDMIIKSLGLDDSHTRQEMERKAPAIVVQMLTRKEKRVKKDI